MRFPSIKSFFRRGLDSSDASAISIIESAPSVAPSAVVSSELADSVRMIDALENDILKVIAAVAHSAHSAKALSSETKTEIEHIRGGMAALADNGRGAAADVVSLAATTEELTMVSNEISAALANANDEIRDASRAAHQATSLIAELSQATREIGGVVQTIADVARQTNLLALNATIEAARAGAAGRGFAVVAGEVKSLAVETGNATADIGRRIERLSASAGASIEAIERIVEIIGRIEPRFTTVESSVGQQIDAIAELAQRASEASAFVARVSENVATMDDAAASASGRVLETDTVTEKAAELAGDLGRRFTMVVREADLGNRRIDPRYPIALPVELESGGVQFRLSSLDISRGGLRLAASSDNGPRQGMTVRANVAPLGSIDLQVVAQGRKTLHCAFVSPSEAFRAALDLLIEDRAAHYSAMVAMMQERASAIVTALEQAVRDGRVTLKDLFEPVYRPVPETAPEQFETTALRVLEELLPPIQEPILAMDPNIVFCCAVDLNGYLGVHHKKYSLPQRKGDLTWNLANCRNKRIFDDRFGVFAVRAMRPFVMQTFERNMGDKLVRVASVDVPLRIFDRPWGGLRLGYQM